jgi:hypothetical protein
LEVKKKKHRTTPGEGLALSLFLTLTPFLSPTSFLFKEED